MSQQRVEIWVDQLEDITRAARVYEDARKEMNEEIYGNGSDLEFILGPVDIQVAGAGKTTWRIDHWDDATYFVVDNDPVTG